MIGSVLGGKYRIEGELSRGGMGAVYRARHELIQRPVAVKVLRPELTGNEELVARFVNEAKAASAISHPSIIEVFDFGYTEDGEAYLVMELLEGESLSARIQARGRLPEREAVRIVRSIAGALSAAHAKGIIHRDLKPDNVFIVADPDLGERAKVLDFGIAKLAESQHHTATGALMGTPLYMAPEQARSAAGIDQRADLYSLGCILYELVTGRPPLVGEGAGEIIALHMFTTPDPPSTLVSDITPALDSIIMQLLEKEPDARFSSAAELSNALSSAYGATGVRPATPLPLPIPGTSPRLPAAVAAPTIATPKPARNFLPLLAVGATVAIAGIVAVAVALNSGADKPAKSTAPTEAPIPVMSAPAPAPAPPAPAPAPDVEPAPVVEKPRPPSRPKRPVRNTTDKGSPTEPTI